MTDSEFIIARSWLEGLIQMFRDMPKPCDPVTLSASSGKLLGLEPGDHGRIVVLQTGIPSPEPLPQPKSTLGLLAPPKTARTGCID